MLRWVVVGLVLLTIILVPFFLWEEHMNAASLRWLEDGNNQIIVAALVAALLAADILLPVPSSLVAVAAGALLGWQFGALASLVGMTAGCLVGYWIGAVGAAPIVRRFVGPDEMARARALVEKVGFGSIITARAVPVLAEATAVAAGMAQYPMRRFLSAATLANLAVSLVYALVGAYALETGAFLIAFFAAIIVPATAFWIWQRWFSKAGVSRG